MEEQLDALTKCDADDTDVYDNEQDSATDLGIADAADVLCVKIHFSLERRIVIKCPILWGGVPKYRLESERSSIFASRNCQEQSSTKVHSRLQVK